jgi:DNA polymerase-3 subunit beta
MKTTAKADALADALDFVSAAIAKKIVIPIPGAVRIEARDGQLRFTASDLDIELTASISAPEAESGVAVVPAARLTKLVGELPADADVQLALADERLAVKSGRGRWSLPTLPPEDFPVLDPPGDGAASFVIPKAEAHRLVRRTQFAISTEETRYYLNGIHLAKRGRQLIAVATDGYRLAEAIAEIDSGAPLGAIVPRKAVEVLDEIAGDVTLHVTDQRIEFVGAGRRCISKLIDGTYPDYARVVPATSGNIISVESTALLGGIGRLDAVAGAKDATAIGIEWADGTFALSLAREPSVGTEEIEPISMSGTARVAAQAGYLTEQIKALDAKIVQLDYGGDGGPIRITRPDEPSTVTMLMPLAWDKPAVAAEPVRKPRQLRRGGRR